MKKKNYLIFVILTFLIINLVNSATVEIPGTGSSGVVSMGSGDLPDGSGSTDREKWQKDKTIPLKWKEYDKSLTRELTPGELKANPNEARALWNSNKLSEQQKTDTIKLNYQVNIRNLDGSSITNENGKETLTMKNGVSIPLDSFKGSNFNFEIDSSTPSHVKITDSKGEFKYLTDQGQLKGPNDVSPKAETKFSGGPSEEASYGKSFGNTGSSSLPTGGSIFDQSVSVMQNLLTLISNIAGGIKDILTSNAKGKSTVTSLGDDQKIVLEDGAEMSVKTLEEKDEEGNPKEVKLAGTDTSKKAEFILDNKLNSELRGNNIFVIPKVASVITKSDTPATKVIHTMAQKGAPTPITAAVINEFGTGQYVKIIKHDIEMKGEKYYVYLFKPFDNLDVECNNVSIRNGDAIIVFDGNKMYYPRYVNYTPYFINTIKNEKDLENIFRLLQGGSSGNYLADDRKIITFGDRIVPHPNAEGLIVSKTRERMWDYMKQ